VACSLLLLLPHCYQPPLPSLLLLLQPLQDQAVAPSPCALLLHALLLQCVLLCLPLAGTSALLRWPCRTNNPHKRHASQHVLYCRKAQMPQQNSRGCKATKNSQQGTVAAFLLGTCCLNRWTCYILAVANHDAAIALQIWLPDNTLHLLPSVTATTDRHDALDPASLRWLSSCWIALLLTRGWSGSHLHTACRMGT
jgi:hypothetical protein